MADFAGEGAEGAPDGDQFRNHVIPQSSYICHIRSTAEILKPLSDLRPSGDTTPCRMAGVTLHSE